MGEPDTIVIWDLRLNQDHANSCEIRVKSDVENSSKCFKAELQIRRNRSSPYTVYMYAYKYIYMYIYI